MSDPNITPKGPNDALDGHLPHDGNEYLFTDTFPKGTVKGLVITAIAALISVMLFNVLPFEANVNKGLSLLVFIGIYWYFMVNRSAACDHHSHFSSDRWGRHWYS